MFVVFLVIGKRVMVSGCVYYYNFIEVYGIVIKWIKIVSERERRKLFKSKNSFFVVRMIVVFLLIFNYWSREESFRFLVGGKVVG